MQCAGILAIDPGGFTLAELMQLAQFKIDQDWTLQASLMALIANIHRDPKKKPTAFTQDDFYKSRTEEKPPPPKSDISVLKDLWFTPVKKRT